MNPLVTLSRSGAVGVIEIDHPPVNALSQAVRQQLLECFRDASADRGIEAVVLCCAGRTFVAGADIAEFDAPQIAPPDPNEVSAAVEAFDRPVIAALHGTALGGGLELALACHYRLALASTKLGLPEVKLGVLPGAGGTQRLTRIIGAQAALDIMTGGNPIDARRALELGIVDAVVDEAPRENAIAMARRLADERAPLRRLSERTPDGSQLPAGFFDEYRRKLPPQNRGGRAAREIVRCVQAAFELTFAEGLCLERAAFMACKDSPESKALRHVFFAEREAARIPALPRGVELRPIRKIGILGAGTMGGGIAMSFANAGMPVTLLDISDEALMRGLGIVRKNYDATAAKGRITAKQADERMALIRGSCDYVDLGDCDLVIEAAFENLDLKKSICSRLGAVCKPGAIIATNTSTLDVDVLAQASGRPADFLGMHFFSPANVMKLLEVVRGAGTSPQVLATVMALAKKIGKSAVVSGVCFGFIGNRMLEGYLREAEFLLLEGASPARIDHALESFGMAMGPCRMIDMAGVDVAAKVVLEQQKANALPDDPAYRSVVQRLHELGRHGQKTGAGYYRYEGRAAVEDPEVAVLCRELASRHGIAQRSDIGDQEIVERCLYPLINEGARILDEGIAQRAGDIDVVWVQGYGFPAYKGGPMYMADEIGAAEICDRMAAYGARLGNAHGYWNISPLLTRLAATGERFASPRAKKAAHDRSSSA
jgi:3-hydroxyacyl-CoA dehydrogenase